MSDERGTFYGCLVLIAIPALIGVGLRSQSIKQFFVIAGITILGLILLAWSVANYSQGHPFWGTWIGFWSLVLIVAVGSFIVTGDYEQAKKIAQWEWRKPTPTPIPTSAPTPTSVAETPPPSETTTVPEPESPPQIPESVSKEWEWLFDNPSRDQVTQSLNDIWNLSPEEAAKMADELRTIRKMVSGNGKRVAGLLSAVAFEQAKDLNFARAAYKEVLDEKIDDPYATSVNTHLRFLDAPELNPENMEKIYKTIAEEPVKKGWFLVAEEWVWDTTERVALQALLDLRADQLSFRFFRFLWLQSSFPEPYAYLFILLILTVGIKILELPLFAKAAKFSAQLRRLQPEINSIQRMYAGDPSTIQQQLAELYKARGVDLGGGCAGGCAVLIVDLIFIIWVLFALRSFSPQFILDGARFFWISDITQRDFHILLAWLGVSLLHSLITGTSQQMGQQFSQFSQSPVLIFFSVIIGSSALLGIAWYWQWPAYVVIFWMLLTVSGTLISIILKIVWRGRA